MEIEHDEAGHRFVMKDPAGTGELIYHLPRPGVIEMYHTEVAPALRGRGIASALAARAFALAREKGWQVLVTCPYVKQWVARHPEVSDMIVT